MIHEYANNTSSVGLGNGFSGASEYSTETTGQFNAFAHWRRYVWNKSLKIQVSTDNEYLVRFAGGRNITTSVAMEYEMFGWRMSCRESRRWHVMSVNCREDSVLNGSRTSVGRRFWHHDLLSVLSFHGDRSFQWNLSQLIQRHVRTEELWHILQVNMFSTFRF